MTIDRPILSLAGVFALSAYVRDRNENKVSTLKTFLLLSQTGACIALASRGLSWTAKAAIAIGVITVGVGSGLIDSEELSKAEY